MSSSWKRRLQNVDGKNDGISLPCIWKMEARLLLFGAANYAGLTKRRHAFCFHTDYVFQSLWHSYCSILTNIMSSPLKSWSHGTKSRFHVQLRDNKADLLSINLENKLWFKIFGENENICHQNTNKIQAVEPQCWPIKQKQYKAKLHHNVNEIHLLHVCTDSL